MLKSHVITERAAALALARVHQLEQDRKFEDAFSHLSNYFWEDLESDPVINNLFSKSVQAEIWLRCGVVLGWYSNFKQVKDWNLRARDWLSKSHFIYTGLNNLDKLAECELELGINYWREGDYSNSEVWMKAAQLRNVPDNKDLQLKIFSNSLLLLTSQRNFKPCLEIIKKAEDCLDYVKEDVQKIPFYLNCAWFFEETHNFDEALQRYEKVIELATQTKDDLDLAIAENNIGNIYRRLGDTENAIEYSRRAENRLVLLNDLGRQAGCLESRARIHLEEGDLIEALKCIDSSIRLLESGEEYSTLAESVWTKVEILLQLGENIEGYKLFTKLIYLAEAKISETTAVEFVKRFDEIVHPVTNYSFDHEMILFERKYLEFFLRKNNFKISPTAQMIGVSHQRLRDLLRTSHQDLNKLVPERTRTCQRKSVKTYSFDNYELQLPSNINPILIYRTETNRLSSIGIDSDTLAVCVEPDLTKKLPIIARNIETGEIFSGFYDEFSENLGFVALLTEDSEPILIQSELAQIFGTIIGFCKFCKETGSYEFHKLKL